MPGHTYRATATSRRTVLVPVEAQRLPDGLWLYASTKRLVMAAENVTGRLAKKGTAWVPGSNESWSPPFAEDTWADWLGQARDVVGPIRTWVVARPRDARRRRFNLLMLDGDGHGRALAKFTANPLNRIAVRAQAALTAAPPTGFWAPPLLDRGELAGWSYRILGVMPQQPHRPAKLSGVERHAIVREYQDIWRTAQLLPQPLIHGDFGPWNVRRLRDGRIAVIDWEEVRPGATAGDEVWHAVTSRLVRRLPPRATARGACAELSHLPASAARDAIDDWLASRDGPEPTEVIGGSVKPKKVLRFEDRIRESLRRLRTELR